jgi:LDH2 family malate/lactate/ureidoglycolate dehydrogenase
MVGIAIFGATIFFAQYFQLVRGQTPTQSGLLTLPLFTARVATLVQQIKASELAPGVERILLPGELESARRQARLQDGIPISEDASTTLQAIAANLGLRLEL